MARSMKLDDIKRAVKDKAKELDEKYRIREKAEQAAQTVEEAARKGADAVSQGVQSARDQYRRADPDAKVAEGVKRAADRVTEAVKTGGKAASEKASEVANEVEKHYEKFQNASDVVKTAGRTGQSFISGIKNAKSWIIENPGKTAVVSLSLITGIRAGSSFANLGAVLLGAGGAGHWLFHSALAPYGLRKLSEKYVEYLKKQEALLAQGQLSDAEHAKLEFQKNITKYVGAPLLGAFSVTLGATMIAESFSPTQIVGAPVEILLGGNPILSSIWLFSNGLICIHNGYKFFMIALAEEEQVQEVVQQIKGMLPAAS
jgi:hypothetical protein